MTQQIHEALANFPQDMRQEMQALANTMIQQGFQPETVYLVISELHWETDDVGIIDISDKKDLSVFHSQYGWTVYRPGSQVIIDNHDIFDEAVKEAKRIAQQEATQVTVYGEKTTEVFDYQNNETS